MTASSPARISVFFVVAAAHAALIGGLSCLEATPVSPREELIVLEFIPEPEVVPEPEPEKPTEMLAGNEDAAPEEALPETTEIAATELPAETLPPPPARTDYVLEDSHDAAAGKDGEVRGDGLDAAEQVAETQIATKPENAGQTIEPAENPPAEIAAKTPLAPQADAETVSGGEKIGKQGLTEATREGSFGNEGAGGDSATATVRYRRRVTPKYPRADKLAGRTGTVILLLEIDENGKLLNVSIRQSSGSRSLDAAAIQAARASKYLPAHDGERAVASRAEASYTFSR